MENIVNDNLFSIWKAEIMQLWPNRNFSRGFSESEHHVILNQQMTGGPFLRKSLMQILPNARILLGKGTPLVLSINVSDGFVIIIIT